MENSKILLQKAIDILEAADIKDDEWAVGGGTVLAHYYNHRISKDIDIFINDIQLLTLLSPRFNDMSEDAADYDEMATYISLTYPEGKIDFIVGSQMSEFLPKKQFFLEKNVVLEDRGEIDAKKIFYRGVSAKVRDIFDLAIVYVNRKKDLIHTLNQIPAQAGAFFARLDAIKQHPENLYSIYQNDSILPGGIEYLGKEAGICDDLKKYLHFDADFE